MAKIPIMKTVNDCSVETMVGSKDEAYILDLENHSVEKVWESDYRDIDCLDKHFKLPNKISRGILNDGQLYLGLSGGAIRIIDLASGEVKAIERADLGPEYMLWDKFGGKEGFEETKEGFEAMSALASSNPEFRKENPKYSGTFDDIIQKTHQNLYRLEGFFPGNFFQISGFVLKDGVVYDNSAFGLFETTSSEQVYDAAVHYADLRNGHLVVVPSMKSIKTRLENLVGKDYGAKHALGLVDVETDSCLFQGLFKETYQSGRYEFCIAKDKVYSVDKYYSHIARVKNLTGRFYEVKFSAEISGPFVRSNRELDEDGNPVVWDVRCERKEGNIMSFVMRSDDHNIDNALYVNETGDISIFEDEDMGLLIAKYRADRSSTEIHGLGSSFNFSSLGEFDFIRS